MIKRNNLPKIDENTPCYKHFALLSEMGDKTKLVEVLHGVNKKGKTKGLVRILNVRSRVLSDKCVYINPHGRYFFVSDAKRIFLDQFKVRKLNLFGDEIK